MIPFFFEQIWFPVLWAFCVIGLWIFFLMHAFKRKEVGWGIANLATVISGGLYFFMVGEKKWGWIFCGVYGFWML